MAVTNIRGSQILNNTVQRQDLDTSTVGQAVVTKIIQGSGVTLSSTGADSGTGDVTVSGVSAVSTDAGNQSKLGSDSLIYTPGGINGFVSKTAAYTLTLADRNKYFICSGGSWTLTLPAASAGLSFNIRNDMGISGTTGTITLTPPSGTIDGLSSIALLPQQECIIICDGTNWRTFGLKREVILGTLDITSAVASATVLLPAGYRLFVLDFAGLLCSLDAQTLNMTFSSDGGSTFYSAGYFHGTVYNSSTAPLVLSGSNIASGYIGNISNAAGSGSSIQLKIYPGSSTLRPSWQSLDEYYYVTGGYLAQMSTGGLLAPATTVLMNAVKFVPGGGTINNMFLTVKGIV